MQFEEPDLERFPCLDLAYRALEAGGAAPAVLNAANEIAVPGISGGARGVPWRFPRSFDPRSSGMLAIPAVGF